MKSVRALGIRRKLRLGHRRALPDFSGASLIWLVPIAALLAIYKLPYHFLTVDRAVAYIAALGVIALAARRPDVSLLILIVLLPFQGLLLAKLWAWGLPASAAKDLGTWKEALALGVVVAGARNYFAVKTPADTVDRLALGFVALAAVYFALQSVILPSAPSSLSVRGLGFRETAGFVLLLLAARHAALPADFARRAARVVLLVGAVVAGIAIYEAIFSDAWNRFVVGTMQYTRYEVAVLHTTPQNMWNILTYGQIGGGQVVQSGSVFLSSSTAGFYLLISLAIGLERTLRRVRFAAGLLPTLVIAIGLILTQTRSAIIGALLIAILAFRPAAGRGAHYRSQAVLVLAMIALITAPAIAASGVVSHFSLLGDSSNTSTHGHQTALTHGLHVMTHDPLGQGLGTGAATGQRFDVQQTTIPEDNYLEVGDELGVLAFLLFASLTVALIIRLRRTARVRDDPLLAAISGAAIGLAVSALFLQTWSNFSVSWTFWALAGAVLAARLPHAVNADERRQGAALTQPVRRGGVAPRHPAPPLVGFAGFGEDR